MEVLFFILDTACNRTCPYCYYETGHFERKPSKMSAPDWTKLTDQAGEEGAQSLQIAAAPNPFNPVSHVWVSLPRKSAVSLTVYSIEGKLIKTLTHGDFRAGHHTFTWDARDNGGNPVSAGVYVYRLRAGNRVLNHKTILAK